MLGRVHNIRHYRACRRQLSCPASVEHGVSKHISGHKHRIEHTVYIIKRMVFAKESGSDDRMKMIPVALAGSKELDGHSHFFGVHHILFGDLRDTLCINIFKIHLLSRDKRGKDRDLAAGVITFHISGWICLRKPVVLRLFEHLCVIRPLVEHLREHIVGRTV